MDILISMSPRSREFDSNTVLDAALDLFWRKGYKGCCMDDVVRKSGVARYGLYQEFKNKDHLYCAALTHYCDKLCKIFDRTFCANSIQTDSINLESHFDQVIEQLDNGEYEGCFAHQAAIERASDDEKVNRIVQSFFDDIKAGYRATLQREIERGQVRDQPIEDLVVYVMGIQRAVIAMTKQNCSLQERKSYVRCALNLLKP